MKVNTLLIYMGYAEGLTLAALPLRHDDGFDSVEDALESFGRCISEGYKQYCMHVRKIRGEYRPCCENNKDGTARFCKDCGNYIGGPEKEIDYDNLRSNLVDDILFGNTDSVPFHIWEQLDYAGWEMGTHIGFGNAVIVKRRGETMIARSVFGRIYDNDDKESVRKDIWVPDGVKVFKD